MHVVGDEDKVAERDEARGVDLRVEERNRVQVESAAGGRSLSTARNRTRRGARAKSLQLEHVELHATQYKSGLKILTEESTCWSRKKDKIIKLTFWPIAATRYPPASPQMAVIGPR